MLKKLAVATALLPLGSIAAAQVVNGSEIIGQQVQVQTNGVVNTVYFQPDGVAQIRSATGALVMDGTWTANGEQLCIRTANAFDCYPYRVPFQAGQPIDVVSTCGVRSQWTALSTVAPPPPPPPTYERG
jgi:hypothetical protein